MTYQKKPLDGALFRNESTNQAAPLYKGKIEIAGGEVYEVAVWERTSKQGKRFLSITGSPKAQQSEKPSADRFDDEVPF